MSFLFPCHFKKEKKKEKELSIKFNIKKNPLFKPHLSLMSHGQSAIITLCTL